MKVEIIELIVLQEDRAVIVECQCDVSHLKYGSPKPLGFDCLESFLQDEEVMRMYDINLNNAHGWAVFNGLERHTECIVDNSGEVLNYDEWKEELIEYKKSIYWIANDGVKYHIFSKFIILDDNGMVDTAEQIKQFEDKRKEYYKYIKENKQELLTK